MSLFALIEKKTNIFLVCQIETTNNQCISKLATQDLQSFITISTFHTPTIIIQIKIIFVINSCNSFCAMTTHIHVRYEQFINS